MNGPLGYDYRPRVNGANITPINRNAGPLCAEMHGGNCPDPATCPYRPIVVDAEWLADWAADDWSIEIEAAEERGLRLGHRNARIQYRQGRFVGFVLGVASVLGVMLALAVIQWVTS